MLRIFNEKRRHVHLTFLYSKGIIFHAKVLEVLQFCHCYGKPSNQLRPRPHLTPEKFANTALFLHLGLPFTLIRRENELFENTLQTGGI